MPSEALWAGRWKYGCSVRFQLEGLVQIAQMKRRVRHCGRGPPPPPPTSSSSSCSDWGPSKPRFSELATHLTAGPGDRSGAPQGGHKTDRARGTECCSGVRALGPQPLIILKTNGNFANPVRAGFDQFLVQPHLEFCRATELNLSQRP